jgi:Cu(I)/Ag(I) efflux system membrane fusion protein
MQKKMSFLVLMLCTGTFLGNSLLVPHALAEESELTHVPSENNYVCPMHSHIVSHEADNCPVCGMKLVPNKSANAMSETEVDVTDDMPAVRVDSAVMNNLGLRIAVVEKEDLVHTIKTIGKVTRINSSAVTHVTPGVHGTIRWITDKYTNDLVEQGELLFVIDSPELFEQQATYQQLLKSGNKTKAATLASQLLAKGLSEKQIELLENGSSPDFPIKVFAKKEARIFTRKGDKDDTVMASTAIFGIGDRAQDVEVTVEVFERNWSRLKAGQHAHIQFRSIPGETFHGTVLRLDKSVGFRVRTLDARIGFKVHGEGVVNQNALASVKIEARTQHNVVTVPVDAVIKTGQGNRVVKILEEGLFQPVAVKIGEESSGRVVIVDGLEVGDKVVTSGQFLIDSESNLLASLRRLSAINQKDNQNK